MNKERALKRGGGRFVVSWEDLPPGDREAAEPSQEIPPGKTLRPGMGAHSNHASDETTAKGVRCCPERGIVRAIERLPHDG